MLWKRGTKQRGASRESSAEPPAAEANQRPAVDTAPDTETTAAGPTAESAPQEPSLRTKYPNLRSSLGPDTSVSGRLSFTVPTRIDGKFRGEIRATDVLVVGETGYVEGTVRAANLVVLGRVNAEILGCERVEVGPEGSVEGVVEARSLLVERGGRVNGQCRIAPARATVHVLRVGKPEAGSGKPSGEAGESPTTSSGRAAGGAQPASAQSRQDSL